MPQSHTLRLIFPQWQGSPPEAQHARAPEASAATAQTGLHLGARILELLAPASETPTEVVPVSLSTHGLTVENGIYARRALLAQLRSAVEVLDRRDPRRVLVLGGDSSVSLAPFAHLVRRYGDSLAVLWLGARPDLATPGGAHRGFGAMALATLLGIGDAEFTRSLPAHLHPSRVLLVGVRSGEPADRVRMEELRIESLAPADLASGAEPVRTWLRATGATRVAVHLDLDVLDPRDLDAAPANGDPPAGLRYRELVRLLREVGDHADVVGLTVAEHLPRTEVLLADLLGRLPLR